MHREKTPAEPVSPVDWIRTRKCDRSREKGLGAGACYNLLYGNFFCIFLRWVIFHSQTENEGTMQGKERLCRANMRAARVAVFAAAHDFP